MPPCYASMGQIVKIYLGHYTRVRAPVHPCQQASGADGPWPSPGHRAQARLRGSRADAAFRGHHRGTTRLRREAQAELEGAVSGRDQVDVRLLGGAQDLDVHGLATTERDSRKSA